MAKLNLKSEVFSRGVEDIITREELAKLLAEGRKLRIKHGIDLTAPDLHLGHAANLWKIRELQKAGHKAVILLGDVTTQIGDPTGKSKARPALLAEDLARNLKTVERQVKKILLTQPALLELRRSSEWYNKLDTPSFLRLLSLVTHSRLIERDMFQKRIRGGVEIHAHELVYPVLQGYDSVMLKSDLTVIGSDQLFNEHLGRMLQEKFGQRPQAIVALKILPGLDGGEKMSKSLGNYIGVEDPPRDKFGKAMRLLDPLIAPYLEAYTDVSKDKIKSLEDGLRRGKNPMEAKLFFAEALVRRYHGVGVARKERENFLRVFSRRELPRDAATAHLPSGPISAPNLLVKLGFVHSKSEARRLILSGAVKINETPLSGKEIILKSGDIIRVGRRKMARIR